jgi:hypothetical protein
LARKSWLQWHRVGFLSAAVQVPTSNKENMDIKYNELIWYIGWSNIFSPLPLHLFFDWHQNQNPNTNMWTNKHNCYEPRKHTTNDWYNISLLLLLLLLTMIKVTQINTSTNQTDQLTIREQVTWQRTVLIIIDYC